MNSLTACLGVILTPTAIPSVTLATAGLNVSAFATNWNTTLITLSADACLLATIQTFLQLDEVMARGVRWKSTP